MSNLFNQIDDTLGLLATPQIAMHTARINQIQAAMDAQNAWSQQQAGMGQLNAYNTPPPPKTDPNAIARNIFCMRMGGVKGTFKIQHPDFLHCHVYADTVYVFYLFKHRDEIREGVAKEDANIFPSDQLIAQFHLVAGV